MMNSENAPNENAPNETVLSFIDLVNMAKWLMDVNQQPPVTQELGRLFPSIRVGRRRGESSEPLRVGAGEPSASATDANNNSFATRSTTKRTVERIWDQKQHQRKHGSLCRIKKPQETLPVNLLFFPV